MSWRTVAPPNAEAFSSGTYSATLRRIQGALGHHHGGQGADEGLGDGHGAVLSFRLQDPEVALVDHAAPVQDDDAVRVVGQQRIAPRHRAIAADGQEAHRVDVVAQRTLELERRTEAARDVDGRHQLAEVRDAPAQRGKLEITPVVETQDAVGRRRRADHPAEPGRIGFDGVGNFLATCGGWRQQHGREHGCQRCRYKGSCRFVLHVPPPSRLGSSRMPWPSSV